MTTNLNSYLPRAEQAAEAIDMLMLDELHLAAPEAYLLRARRENVYLVGSYDPLRMGRSLKVYEHPEIAKRIQLVTGCPTTITKDTGTHYVVLLHGKVSLPRRVMFPGVGEQDVFKLGVDVKGEVRLHADRFQNGMIGAGPGSGKSTILELLIHQARAWGWKLYLADPQSHTFNPDTWNGIASMPVAGSHADMFKVLSAIEDELATRANLFRLAAVNGRVPANIVDYNSAAPTIGAAPLARLALLVDEANFFMGHKPIFEQLADLLRQGRKWGLHIVLAAHEWHKENVPAAVNDLLQTRIALHSLSGAVVLRSTQWGKWVEGRPPGRGVLRLSKYTPMQFYMLDREATVPAGGEETGVCPLSNTELDMVGTSLRLYGGKLTLGFIMGQGWSEPDARALGTTWEARGWLAKGRDNARFLTDAIREIWAKYGDSAPNHQTAQTGQTDEFTLPNRFQTDSKPFQTGSKPLQTEGSEL